MVFNPITYISESKKELEKVVWPTRAETIRLTILVIGVSVIVGAYISGIDAVLANVTSKYLIK